MNYSAAILVALLLGSKIAAAADYTIRNPADRIDNPAGRISNPAGQITNPADKIYNPAANITNPSEQLNNPNPVVTIAPPAPPPAETSPTLAAKPSTPAVPAKYYTFKKVKEYVDAAKKAFGKDDYLEFTAIVEDALRRISSGGLKASRKTIRKLEKFKTFGYSLLTKDD